MLKRVWQGADRFLQRKSKRYKLWRICRALHIKLHPRVREYALGKTNWLKFYHGRQTGRTLSVMLYIMINLHGIISPDMLMLDPDYIPDNHVRKTYYLRQYRELELKCHDAGIMVPMIVDIPAFGREVVKREKIQM